MKFFSTALAALTVGSAVAAPVNDARSIPAVISLPAPCIALSTTTTAVIQATAVPVVNVVQATAVPVVNNLGKSDPGHIGNDKVVVVIHTVVETVNTVEAKVKAHLALIGKNDRHLNPLPGILATNNKFSSNHWRR